MTSSASHGSFNSKAESVADCDLGGLGFVSRRVRTIAQIFRFGIGIRYGIQDPKVGAAQLLSFISELHELWR